MLQATLPLKVYLIVLLLLPSPTTLNDRLAGILGYSEIPALVTSGSASTSTGEQINIPFQSANDIFTTLDISNASSYSVSRANNAPALALSYNSTIINSVRSANDIQIDFIESVDVIGDSLGMCPCNIQLGYVLSRLPDTVETLDDLELFHFTDGRWHKLVTTITRNTLTATVDSFGPIALALSVS